MKKILALLTPTAAYLIAAPYSFAADSFSLCTTSNSGFGSLCNASIGKFISPLITLIFLIALIVSIVYLLWGGIKWIMSGGDKQALQTAREHVIAAIIGLVVVMLVYFLFNFILSAFGVTTGTGNISLPTFN